MGGGKDDCRILIAGFSWDTTQRQLEYAFSRFGRIIQSQIVLDSDTTGNSRGFGYITFGDRRARDDAIREMDGRESRELGGRVIYVNKVESRFRNDVDHGYKGGYASSGKRSYGARDECFKCGRVGHWARDCPSGERGSYEGLEKTAAHNECFKCGQVGHWARDCLSDDGKSYEDVDKPIAHGECFKCGSVGHWARDCPSGERVSYGDLDKPVAHGECYKRGQVGHWARDCLSDDGISYEAVNKPVAHGECFKCGRVGHWARDCPSGGRGSYGDSDNLVGQDECFNWGRSGHWARDCSSGAMGSSEAVNKPVALGECFKCRRSGHWARDCRSAGAERRFDSRDDKYGGRDQYPNRYARSNCFPQNGHGKDRGYGGSSSGRFPQNGHGEDRGLDRDCGSRVSIRLAGAAIEPAQDDRRGLDRELTLKFLVKLKL